MLRIFALLLVVATLFSGCGKTPAPIPEEQLTTPFAELVDTLVTDYALPMPAVFDDPMAETLLGLSPDSYECCWGYLSLSADSPDHIVVVKAVPGSAEAAAKSLEQRREFLLEAYRDQPELYSRVQVGTVAFRGDYVFLVIAGRPGSDPAVETATILKTLEDNFAS